MVVHGQQNQHRLLFEREAAVSAAQEVFFPLLLPLRHHSSEGVQSVPVYRHQREPGKGKGKGQSQNQAE